MRNPWIRRLPARLACAALLFAGCQVYDPSLVQGAHCEGRRPPPRPTGDDGADVDEVFFGLRDVVLDQEAEGLWARLGFNLDVYCTEAPKFAHECEPAEGGRLQPDGDEGIDNVFGSDLFPLVNAAVPGLEDTARAAQLEGVGLPVLRIREWNGTPNDPRVHVTITQSVDTVPATGDGAAPEVTFTDYQAALPGGARAPDPEWDGDDYTWFRADTFLAGNADDPLVYDNNAYVAGGVLVVNLPDRVEILFPAEDTGVMVRLTGGVATGRISEDGQRLEDVVVAGRWSIIDLLRTAENVGICMGSGEYELLRMRLAAIADVSSEVDPDPGVECDAVSLGVGFTGFRVRFGGITEGRPLGSACETPPDGGAADPDAGTGPPDAGDVDAGV